MHGLVTSICRLRGLEPVALPYGYTRLSAMAVVASLLDTSLLDTMAVHTCRRSGLESRSRAKQGKVSSQLPTPRPNRVSRKGLP